ncbi:MAG: FecR family protein, partial [Rhodothermales bacterium]
PDGSLITLNSGTTLTYRRTFGWRTRAIRLEGEAFFDVTASAKVFRVHTFNSAVTVLGTRFNVRAWAQDPTDKTTVVLEEGRVRFAANAAPQQGVVLQPGQMSRVVGDAATPTVPVEVPVDRLMAWRTGGMAFTDQSIGDILAEVERRFGVDVRTTPDSIRDERLSLFLNSVDDVETVLAAICSPRGYRFQATDTGYTLTE